MPPSPSKRRSEGRHAAERFGRRAEFVASWYLRLKGYAVLLRRYKTPVGELDLIARLGSTLVFIEVKTRRHAEGEAEALMAVNQRRIVRAAQYFVARHPALRDSPMRFDVIFLAPGSWPRHLRNAFIS